MVRKPLLLFTFLFLLWNCAGHRETLTVPPVNSGRSVSAEDDPSEPETPPLVPLNPITVEFEIRVKISNPRALSGPPLDRLLRQKGIPPGTVPQLHIWSSAFIARPNQEILEVQLEGPFPRDIFLDEEHKNRIYYWDLTEQIREKKDIELVRHLTVQSYELFCLVDTVEIPAYNPGDPVYRLYTREERFLEQTPEIRRLAQRIASGEKNPFQKARKIFQWVHKNLTYQKYVGKRGALAALITRRGDSGQFADLFVALCRAAGIPARNVFGFKLEGTQLLNRAWAEFYIPGTGWIPADPLAGSPAFAHLPAGYITASVGRNIPLRHSPGWATFSNSEVEDGRTPIMQIYTVASAGVRARFRSQIRVLQVKNGQGTVATVGQESG